MDKFMTPSGLISLSPNLVITWCVIWHGKRYIFPCMNPARDLSLENAEAFAADKPDAWILPCAMFLQTNRGSQWPKGKECGWQIKMKPKPEPEPPPTRPKIKLRTPRKPKP